MQDRIPEGTDHGHASGTEQQAVQSHKRTVCILCERVITQSQKKEGGNPVINYLVSVVKNIFQK